MIMYEAFRRLDIADKKDLFFTAIDGNKPPVPKPAGMRVGNWGCALSKSAVMQEAIAQNKPLLLLEDDVVIHPQIHNIMHNCLRELPDDWKILYLGCKALDPHATMRTHGQQKREVVGKWHEVLANPNLNHAIIIRDTNCLAELAEILADPATYNRDEGRFTSDYTVAQYFAHKGIPMYGVVPAVAKQCAIYSDNENKVVHRNATFQKICQWDIKGDTKFPITWDVDQHIPPDFQNKGYDAAKIHPPFDLTLTLSAKAEVIFVLLDTSRVKGDEKIKVKISGKMFGGVSLLPHPITKMTLLPGEYNVTCHPDGETWRWKHVAMLIKEVTP